LSTWTIHRMAPDRDDAVRGLVDLVRRMDGRWASTRYGASQRKYAKKRSPEILEHGTSCRNRHPQAVYAGGARYLKPGGATLPRLGSKPALSGFRRSLGEPQEHSTEFKGY